MTVYVFSGTRHYAGSYQELGLDSDDEPDPGDIVVVGDARGVDRAVRDAHCPGEYDLRVFDADWEQYGKSAGPFRNRAMLDFAERAASAEGLRAVYVIAFPAPDSRGTWDMIREAVRRGHRVNIYPLAV